MTVYEIPNIENCTVTVIGIMYKIVANEGWYINVNVEGNENLYKGAVALLSTFDFSLVTVVPESELPEGAEICGSITPDIETVTE